MDNIVYRVWDQNHTDYWEYDSFNEAKRKYDDLMEDMRQWFDETWEEGMESWKEFSIYADFPSLEKVEYLY